MYLYYLDGRESQVCQFIFKPITVILPDINLNQVNDIITNNRRSAKGHLDFNKNKSLTTHFCSSSKF